MRSKFDYPGLELDVPASPLMSSTPFTSFLNGVPESATAEKIFNDPDSWENDDADVEDLEDKFLAWLVEGLKKFKVDAFDPAVQDEGNSALAPSVDELQLRSESKGIDRASNDRPISIPCFFESTHDQDDQDRLSKILDASGIPHHIQPLSPVLTPPSSSKIANYPLKINTSAVVGSTADGLSPISVHSSSITMSFLEWYGVYPESDLNLSSLRQQYRKSINPKIVISTVPSPRYAIPPPKDSHPPGRCASSTPPLKLEPLPSPAPTSSPLPSCSRTRSPALTSSQPSLYSRTRSLSPAGSIPISDSRSRSSSNSRSATSTSAPVISSRDSKGRRLPSIPLEASPLPPLRSASRLRRRSSVRSGPTGPRIRAGSLTPGASLPHRPPVL